MKVKFLLTTFLVFCLISFGSAFAAAWPEDVNQYANKLAAENGGVSSISSLGGNKYSIKITKTETVKDDYKKGEWVVTKEGVGKQHASPKSVMANADGSCWCGKTHTWNPDTCDCTTKYTFMDVDTLCSSYQNIMGWKVTKTLEKSDGVTHSCNNTSAFGSNQEITEARCTWNVYKITRYKTFTYTAKEQPCNHINGKCTSHSKTVQQHPIDGYVAAGDKKSCTKCGETWYENVTCSKQQCNHNAVCSEHSTLRQNRCKHQFCQLHRDGSCRRYRCSHTKRRHTSNETFQPPFPEPQKMLTFNAT